MARRFDFDLDLDLALDAYDFEGRFGDVFGASPAFETGFGFRSPSVALFPESVEYVISFDSLFASNPESGVAPTLDVNVPLNLIPGFTAILSTAVLEVNDADDLDSDLVFTLDAAPLNGVLFLDVDGSGFQNNEEFALAAGDSFTQQDINDGLVGYLHDGSANLTDNFQFDVSDGTSSIDDQIFNMVMTVTPFASFELANLNGINGFVLRGIDERDESGISVSNAGDINGDGFDDILIGADEADPNGSRSGESYVVFGRDTATNPFDVRFEFSSLDGTNGFVINGIFGGNQSGGSVSNAGDINGDGFDDILIGAFAATPNGYHSGQTYVVFGRDTATNPFAASFELSALDGTNGFVINGIESRDRSGFSVSSAGDINGDGFDDILIGAYTGDPNGSSSGESYIVFGSGSPYDASLDLSSLDGTNGFVINGIDANDLSGRSVSSAGDINGDGFDDILIGATHADPNGNSSGESYVVFGRDTAANPFAASLELSTLDGLNGFVLNGIDGSDFSGRSVSSAGDINDDGFDDILIGAFRGGGSGESYVVFGRDTAINPFAASLDLSALDGVDGFVLNGIDGSDESGRSVSSAGDINGDGFDDILIGAPAADPNGYSSGESYVVFGRDTATNPFSASFDLSTLDGSNGFVINGIDDVDRSGWSVSSAGDINADGFDDILIGASGADPATGFDIGESYIIYGAASFPSVYFSEVPTLDVNAPLDLFPGFTAILSAAELEVNDIDSLDSDLVFTLDAAPLNGVLFLDVDGSGGQNNAERALIAGDSFTQQDITDGLVGYRNDSGLALPDSFQFDISDGTRFIDDQVFNFSSPAASFELSALDGSNGFVLNGVDFTDRAGISVSSAGDINGDGFDDILIGAEGAYANGSQSGESYIVFGRDTAISPFVAEFDLSTLDGVNGFVLNGIVTGDESGNSVSGAGDINGDGFDDILIAAKEANPNGGRSGETYVVFGRDTATNPFAASFELSAINGTNGFVLNGEDNDRSGISVSNAGDINGDGFDDILIGAYAAEAGGRFNGQSYVVFGRDTIINPFAASLELSALDGTNGFALNGIDESDWSGGAVSSAGDINGDGFDDILIGARSADPNGVSSGESYLVFGSGDPFSASIELSALDGTNGFVINGIDQFDDSGISVSNAGDFNGDGFDDILIGAIADANGISNSGQTYLIFGRDTDINPFAASLELSSLDGTSGFIINGIDVNNQSGRSVSSAGDINGDGFDDILIGAPVADPNGRDSGESYVIFGRDTAVIPFSANFDLSTLNGVNGVVINGIESGDESGGSVSSAGDINGDGFDDLLIGASRAEGNNLSSGESYIIFGGASLGYPPDFVGSAPALEINTGLTLAIGDVGVINAAALTTNDPDTLDSEIVYTLDSTASNGTLWIDSDGSGSLNNAETALMVGDSFTQADIIAGLLSYEHDGSAYATDSFQFDVSDAANLINDAVFDIAITGRVELTLGNDVFTGTSGDDAIAALAGNDIVNGADGADSINGGDGNDRLSGDAGGDTLNGDDGADTLIGGEGADALNGGTGFDSADYRGAASGVRFNVETGGTLGEALGDSFSGIERYYLSDFNDIITGSDANEFFYGEDGNDQINGGGGIDRIYGGDGDDVQRGQEGNDTLYGSAGADQLNGGTGFDIANYSNAASSVIVRLLGTGVGGDAAGDTYFGIEAVYGSDFNDALNGNNSANELRGGGGNDTLEGFGGNDRLYGGEGGDILDGGTGTDIAVYTAASSAVGVNLNGVGTLGEADGDFYESIEWVWGSAFDDTITGDAANNRLEGRDGNDTLNGEGGNDRLLGGDGNDIINGGDGVDTIFGQDGDDVMTGGAGNDFFFGGAGADSHDGGTGTDTVSYLASGPIAIQNGIGVSGDAAGDTYTDIERYFGSSSDDIINASGILLGNGGNDYLLGMNGSNDSLNGGAGVDTFAYDTTGGAADVIQGFFLGEQISILGGDMNFDTEAEVLAAGTDAGANVIFDFGGGNTLTLVGVNLADLPNNTFTFDGPLFGQPLDDPGAFAADVIDIFDMYSLL